MDTSAFAFVVGLIICIAVGFIIVIGNRALDKKECEDKNDNLDFDKIDAYYVCDYCGQSYCYYLDDCSSCGSHSFKKEFIGNGK